MGAPQRPLLQFARTRHLQISSDSPVELYRQIAGASYSANRSSATADLSVSIPAPIWVDMDAATEVAGVAGLTGAVATTTAASGATASSASAMNQMGAETSASGSSSTRQRVIARAHYDRPPQPYCRYWCRDAEVMRT
jgi:hypothetical protein